MKYHNGDEYNGEFKLRQKHGIGTYIFNNGDKYIGSFIMGKKGEGQFDYNNGDTFTGEFTNDFDDDFNKI